jgi:hypothetical protein
MNTKSLHVACLVVAVSFICPILTAGEEPKPVQFLKPVLSEDIRTLTGKQMW